MSQIITAITTLGREDATAAQADEILVARAEILRGMCMPERAVGLLRHALPTVSSPRNRTRLVLELAACTADIGDVRGAFQMLNDLLPTVEPGPLAHRAALALADLCVRNGRQAQAIALARGLLAPSSPDEVRQSAQQILGRAYVQQKDYERAAALRDQIKELEKR
jgi:tetratricopeptide (TPR) repeat protein